MKKESKFMSLVLRHTPEAADLTMDAGGWVLINDLLSGMRNGGFNLSEDELLLVVKTSDKKRFTISEDGMRIRAAQGHSVKIDLGLEAKRPPDQLLHGTAEKNIPSILENGLLPQQRQHVHLSVDEVAALKVGARHGKPNLLRINAKAMFEDGHAFWLSDNGVWLSNYVPVQYIKS